MLQGVKQKVANNSHQRPQSCIPEDLSSAHSPSESERRLGLQTKMTLWTENPTLTPSQAPFKSGPHCKINMDFALYLCGHLAGHLEASCSPTMFSL